MEKSLNFINEGSCNSPHRNNFIQKQRDNPTNLFMEYLKMDQDLMMMEQSPKKAYRQDGTNDKQSLSDSAHKNKNSSIQERKNPFSMFYEQVQQKNLFKQCQKPQIIELSFIQQQKQGEIVEEVRSLSQSQISQQYPYKEEYNQILLRMGKDQDSTFYHPIFFQCKNQNELTKLLLFRINKKNGRTLRYDLQAKTVRPFFKCQGCKKQFAVSSALGGHLSKCDKKQKHFLLVSQKESIINQTFQAAQYQSSSEWKNQLQLEQESCCNQGLDYKNKSLAQSWIENVYEGQLSQIIPIKQVKKPTIIKKGPQYTRKGKRLSDNRVRLSKAVKSKSKNTNKRSSNQSTQDAATRPVRKTIRSHK